VQEPGDYLRHNRLTREFFHCVADCTKPVICAVNGPAIGAGFALMSCCDILLMSEDSWVQMPELDVGLAGGAAFLLRHFSPPQRGRCSSPGGAFPPPICIAAASSKPACRRRH
jgi:enoyl-CoA hydratase